MTARNRKSIPYTVGYGKPPRHTRFRKGQSGNPLGRPPRDPAKRLKAMVLQEAYRGTTLKEGRRRVAATLMQAILRSQIELATKGNFQAQRAIVAAVQKIEQDNERDEMLARMRGGWSGPETGACGAHEYEPGAAERSKPA